VWGGLLNTRCLPADWLVGELKLKPEVASVRGSPRLRIADGAGSQCGVAGGLGHVELVRPQLRGRRLPLRPAREPRRRGLLRRARGASRRSLSRRIHDAAAFPGPVPAGRGRAGARVATAPRRGFRRGAAAGGGREEDAARAEVAELAVQGRHLLQEDRPLGVAHLVSLSSRLLRSSTNQHLVLINMFPSSV
jgi:hypothetical protein